MSQNKRSHSPDAVEILTHGELQIVGRMPYSSNNTFLVDVALDSESTRAIYKPGKGERDLWDFPGGLFLREIAAYELSEALGWGLVPPTIYRADGPFGEGSLQLFVDADFEQHYFSLFENHDLHAQFKTFALFDVVANNADRKSGHLLIDGDSHVWGIDQGLCFHSEPKLRTVIWEFAGEPVPEQLLCELESKRDECLEILSGFILQNELEAFEKRLTRITAKRKFPAPDPDMRCYPWPLV